MPLVHIDAANLPDWIGTPAGVFWTQGTNIYRRENAQ